MVAVWNLGDPRCRGSLLGAQRTVWGRGVSQVRLRAVAGEGKLVGWGAPALGEGKACSEKCFLILEKEEEGFLPARGPLRPGEEERKTEIETEQEGGGWIWADRVGGSKDRSTRDSQAMRLPHPGAQPHIHLHHHDS